MYFFSIFWFVMGILSLIIIFGFKNIAESKGLQMNWWKWIISIAWWMGFLFSVAVPATFMGEGELYAGAMMILFSVVPATILGFIVWRIISSNRITVK